MSIQTKPRPQLKNQAKATPIAYLVPKTKLDITVTLDPDDCAVWLMDRAKVGDGPSGFSRSVGGWHSVLAEYVKDRTGCGCRTDQWGQVVLLVGDQDYASPLPVWAKKFVTLCEREPQGWIPATKALELLAYARDPEVRI